MGIARDRDGDLYVALCCRTKEHGIWRITPKGSVSQIAPLPPEGCPNGIALDERHGYIYVADSLLSTIWRVSVAQGTFEAWATGAALAPAPAPDRFLGANGLKLHDDAIWVSNTDAGTLLQIPIQSGGKAGAPETRATGLKGIDDFDFAGESEEAQVLAAINSDSKLVLIDPDGNWKTVLTKSDGLRNPTSVAVTPNSVYVASGGYGPEDDPNLLRADLTTC